MNRVPAYLLSASVMAAATPAMAELRQAPDYFIGALIATEIAQAIAINCPVLSVNPQAAQKMSEDVMNWLAEDGFDEADPTAEMENPNDQLNALQARFMDKHQLAGAGADKVCAAGKAEMADETDIGNLLVEVAQ